MAVDPKFAGALIDNTNGPYSSVRIFGLRLRKFCLWHSLLLKTINSPFLVRGGRVTLFDLKTAIGICRLRFGQSKVSRPTVVPFLYTVWWFVLFLFSNARTGQPSPKQRGLRKLLDRFLDYAGDYLQDPEFTVIPVKGRTTGTSLGEAPEEITIASDVISLGIPERRVWEMPLGLAKWYQSVALKKAGVAIDYMTPSEKAFQDRQPPEFRRSYAGA